MKKALIVFIVFVIVTLLSIYIFIPAQLDVSTVTVMKTNTNALFRYLSNEEKWTKWWPVNNTAKTSIEQKDYYSLNNYRYRLTKQLYNAVEVEAAKNDITSSGKIVIIPLAEDSLIVRWTTTFSTSNNPFYRLKQYYEAVNIKNNMKVIFDSLRSFAEDKRKLYKYNISRTTLTDTLLIATKTVTQGYPETEKIYQLVKKLQTYISTEKTKEVDFPIMNITQKDSTHYELMVAIPTNIVLKGNEEIAFKRMIAYPGKIVTAEVIGGADEIKKAYEEIAVYMNDYNLVSPVIHWESLITDRSKEADSTKWKTKIFMPIV